jgi:NADH dehydrogenase/NADH:ubiquinone oxidoreductase subunit G
MLTLVMIGALVSKPNLYRGRSWEFNVVDSVDIMDSHLINISIYSRGNEIYRIQPRSDRQHTNDWISDRSRYLIDSFDTNRIIISSSFVKKEIEHLTINSVYSLLKHVFSVVNIAYILGSAATLDDHFLVSNLKNIQGKQNIYYSYFNKQNLTITAYATYMNRQKNTFNNNFLLNDSTENLHLYDCFLFLNNTFQYTLPVLHNKLKTCSKAYEINWISIGTNAKDSIRNISNLQKVILGKHKLSKAITQHKRIQIFTEDINNTLVDSLYERLKFTYYVDANKQSQIIWNTISFECGVLMYRSLAR